MFIRPIVERTNIVLTFDIESTGQRLIHNKPISISFLLCDENEHILQKDRFNFEVKWPTIAEGKIESYGDFDPVIWHRHWKNDARVKKEYLNEPKPDTAIVVWNSIAKYLDELFMNYKHEAYYITIIPTTEEHQYILDYGLEYYTNHKPVQYIDDTSSHNIYCSNTLICMIPCPVYNASSAEISAKLKTLDDPSFNGPYFFYLLYLFIQKYRQEHIDNILY